MLTKVNDVIFQFVTSQWPIQNTKIFYTFFDLYMCLLTLKEVPPPMNQEGGTEWEIIISKRFWRSAFDKT